VAVGATVLAAGALPASAVGLTQSSLATAVPQAKTPDIVDGAVLDMQQMSNGHIVVSGSFTQVQDMATTGTPTLSRSSVFSFDPTTGRVDPFAPVISGTVNAVWPGPTAGTVFLAGKFTPIAGTSTKNLALLNLTDATPVQGFTAPVASGAINDIETFGNEAYIGGFFTSVTSGGVASPRGGLASFNATTGALDSNVTISVAQRHGGGTAVAPVGVGNLDLNGTGDRMAIIGNFKTVNGLPRQQLAIIDLPSGGAATVDPWMTTGYNPGCATNAFDYYVRGVQWSPNGTYFVVTATGGGGLQNPPVTLCDAASRFNWPDPNGTTAAGAKPYWVDYTGNDTLYSVAVSGDAVYVGGHERWLNNQLASDRAGAGAVPRPGVAALDPLNGVPLSWNPGRNPRGVGAQSLLLTPQGLFVGSDTNYIGNRQYLRKKIAYFPLSGLPLASQDTGNLSMGRVYLAGTSGGSNNVTARTYDGNTGVGPDQSVGNGGIPWSQTRGGVWIGGNVYYGRQNGTTWELVKQPFDGSTFGTPTFITTPYKDPYWDGVDNGSGSTYDGVFPNFYSASDLGAVSGMFYWNGRLYYTKTGSSSLFFRGFSVDSGIVSAVATTGATSGFTNVSGMFIDGGFLYTSDTSGKLFRRTFNTTTGAIGTTTTQVASSGWATRNLFIAPNPGTSVNHAPSAAFTAPSCTVNVPCSFNGSSSSDPDGDTLTYAWDFGDGGTGTGATPSHTYTTTDPETVTLTVTDTHGASSSPVQHTVTVSPASTGPGISVVGAIGTNSGTASGVSSRTVTLPGGIQAGDGIVAAFTSNNANQAVTPAGYSLVGTQTAPSSGTAVMTTRVFQRVADGSEGGTQLTVALPAGQTAKAVLQVIVYHGTASSGPVASFTGASDGSTTSHALPAAPFSNGQRVLGVWADKSSSARTWTPPSGFTQEDQQAGLAVGGSVSGLLADQAETSSGSASGTATTSATSTKGVMITLVIASGP
jgi:PKD repeat protein